MVGSNYKACSSVSDGLPVNVIAGIGMLSKSLIVIFDGFKVSI